MLFRRFSSEIPFPFASICKYSSWYALARYVRTRYPDVTVYHEDRPDIPEGVKVWRPGKVSLYLSLYYSFSVIQTGPDSEKIDLVVTLGGDGTILHASSLFKVGAVPPVLSFSMGTLGFLLPFRKHRNITLEPHTHLSPISIS